ncbi:MULTISPECIES: hypothetical protein [unclassified Microcoleus]
MSTIIYLRCGVQLQIDRPYHKKVRSPATTKSFQRQEDCTAARSPG